MTKVLFLCVHNSARSQMGQAFLRKLGGTRFIAESAGIEPGKLNQHVVRAMAEIGIDISGNPTKSVFDLAAAGKTFDVVVTVCSKEAAERCPVFPGLSRKIHWPFDDPSSFKGTDSEIMERTRTVRDQIEEAVRRFIGEFPARQGGHVDIPGVLALQEKNLVTNLSEDQKKDGFVTTPFTAEQLSALVDLDGLFVLELDGQIRGYTMAAGWDYFKGRPMFDLMIERFSKLSYEGKQITYTDSFQYGPICVDRSLRGSPAFLSLFDVMKNKLSEKYTVGTTFINKVNGRSFRAHAQKAKLDVIDEFEFNGNSYYGLAFLTTKEGRNR